MFQAALAEAGRLPLVGRAVKFAFVSKDGRIENMWVRVTSRRGDKIRGVLMSTPLFDQGALTKGAHVMCDMRTASDLML
jgi:hypothetical protein